MKPLSSGASLTVQVTGVAGVPTSGVSAVVINLTTTNAAGPGYITAYTGGNTPSTSNVNYNKGQNVANLALVAVSAAGTITLHNTGYTTDLIADINGYYLNDTSAEPGAFTPLPAPQRVLDTRVGTGAPVKPLSSGASLTVQVTGVAGVPTSGVSAVAINLTTTNAAGPGYITAYTGGNTPSTSNVNYNKGQNVANLALVAVSAAGTITLHNTGYTTDLIADINGYYLDGPPASPGGYSPVTPTRLLDTRTGTGAPVAPGQSLTLRVAGAAGLPSSGLTAVVVNLTATNAAGPGYITAYAGGAGLPAASNVNFDHGRTVANLAVVPVSAAGTISLNNGGAGTDLVVDVDGYYLGPPADTTAPGPVTDLTVSGTTRTATTLSWTNPTDADFAAVEIRRAVGTTAPASIGAGTLVATVDAGATTYTDAGLAPDTQYSYAVFARDNVPNWAVPTDVSMTTSPLTWGTAQSLPPAGDGPLGLSCATTTFCMMITYDAQAIPIENGRPNTPTAIDLPTGAILAAISCPTTTFCMAIDNSGHAFRYNGSSWTMTSVAKVQDQFSHLSCTGVSFCMAAYGDRVFTWNGTVWSPATPNANVAPFYLSCGSATFCMSIELNLSGKTEASYLASRWNGSTWSAPVSLGTAGTFALSCTGIRCLAAGSQQFVFNGKTWSATATTPLQPLAASCTSATRCTAIGGTIATGPSLETSTFDGRTWSPPQRVPGVWSYAGSGLNQWLSCVAMACLDVDTYGNAYRSDGRNWDSVGNLVEPNDGLQYLSCASSTMCMGLDEFGHVTRFDGTSWQALGLLDPSLASPALPRFQALSCPSTTFCLTIDGYTGSTWVYDGQRWTNRGQSGQSGNYELSCGSPMLCLATGYSATDLWNGKTWSSVNLGPDANFEYMSCVSDFCAGINRSRFYTYDAGVWSWVAVSGLNPYVTIDGLSCGAPGSCLAVQGSEAALSYNNGRFTAIPLSIPGAYQAAAVSCTSATACYIAVSIDLPSRGADTTGIKVVTWNGTSVASDGPTALPTHYHYYGLTLSCVDSGFCAAGASGLVNTTT